MTLTPIANRDAERRKEDRTARYLARIDEHLPTILSVAEKRAFLRQQAAAWEFRRERFYMTDGDSEPVTNAGDPPQASDFTMTLLGLSVRLETLED